jgi:hypothetical protein
MANLLATDTRAEVERLIEKVREYRDNLTAIFDAACRRRMADGGAHARAACARLSDDLGVTLLDQVRRMTIRSYGDNHGECEWCAAGEDWWPQVTGDPR